MSSRISSSALVVSTAALVVVLASLAARRGRLEKEEEEEEEETTKQHRAEVPRASSVALPHKSPDLGKQPLPQEKSIRIWMDGAYDIMHCELSRATTLPSLNTTY